MTPDTPLLSYRKPWAGHILRYKIRSARYDTVCGDGLWKVRHHRERVCSRGMRHPSKSVMTPLPSHASTYVNSVCRAVDRLDEQRTAVEGRPRGSHKEKLAVRTSLLL